MIKFKQVSKRKLSGDSSKEKYEIKSFHGLRGLVVASKEEEKPIVCAVQYPNDNKRILISTRVVRLAKPQ